MKSAFPLRSSSISLIRAVSLLVCYSIITPYMALPSSPGTRPGARPKRAASAEKPAARKPNSKKTAQGTAKPRWRDGELLVQFRPGTSDKAIDSLLQTNSASRITKLRGLSGIVRVGIAPGLDPGLVATTLSANPAGNNGD
jgi:hypothetical protein